MTYKYEEALNAYVKSTFTDGVFRNWMPRATSNNEIYFVSKEDNLICFVPPWIQALRTNQL